MSIIKSIIRSLETLAPPSLQESYDNAGLIVGDPSAEVTGILTTLDCTEPVVDEAIAKGVNLIVAHHPIVFRGLKSLTGKNYIERTVLKAIKNDVAIYAIHTNLDNVQLGVNNKICEVLGLENTKILAPKSQLLKKLTVFAPKSCAEKVRKAMSDAGAGQIGNYKDCSFTSEGQGRFTPNEHANPFEGKQGVESVVSEERIEVIFPNYLQGAVLSAMNQAHDYEEVAYYLQDLANKNQEVGSGIVGKLAEPMDATAFLQHLKDKLGTPVVRHTPLVKDTVQTIAVCGGAGSFLLRNAIGAKADVFVTGDFKYHEFFDAEENIIIADVGHYESEACTKELLADYLSRNFPNIAVALSETRTNPVNYFF